MTLYSELEMVDESTFIEWRDKGTETAGKGVAVHLLADFFRWLEKASEESDPESWLVVDHSLWLLGEIIVYYV